MPHVLMLVCICLLCNYYGTLAMIYTNINKLDYAKHMAPTKKENVQIRVCRVCLNSSFSASVSLYADYWLNLYEYCFGLSISAIDVSRKVCVLCAGEMIKFAKFKEQCLRSNKLWNDIMCRDLTCHVESPGIKKEHIENIDINIKTAHNVEIFNDLKFEVDGIKQLAELDTKNFESQHDFENGEFEIENDDLIIDCKDTKHYNRLEDIKANIDFDKSLCNSLTNDEIDKKEIEFEDSKDSNNIQDFEDCKDRSNLMSSPNCDTKDLAKKCEKLDINKQRITDIHLLQRTKKSDKSSCKIQSDVITKKKIPKTNKKVNPVYECGLCESSFTTYEELGQHLEMHRTNLDTCCKQCGYSGRDFADLISHRFVHHSKEYGIIFKCHLCNRICRRDRILQFHYRSVHMGQKGGLCIYCKKTIGVYKKWNSHERLHENARFICDHCGRKFLYRYQIKDHLSYHTAVINSVCDICGRGFIQMRNLMSHLKRAHDTQQVKCTHCNKFFKNKFNLHLHLKSIEKKKTVCKICSKEFPNYSSMKYHMIWHTDERPFSCEICGKCYKVNNQLTIHMRKHTGDFPYKCNFCSRAFPSLNQKKVHQSVHTGVRAYKCKYCDKSFHMKKSLAEHCAKKHKVEIVELKDNSSRKGNEK